MDIQRLLNLGFHSTGGQIDYRNVNYGVALKDGTASLTPEGEELVAELEGGEPVARKAPAKKAAAKKAAPPIETPPADDDVGLGDLG